MPNPDKKAKRAAKKVLKTNQKSAKSDYKVLKRAGDTSYFDNMSGIRPKAWAPMQINEKNVKAADKKLAKGGFPGGEKDKDKEVAVETDNRLGTEGSLFQKRKAPTLAPGQKVSLNKVMSSDRAQKMKKANPREADILLRGRAVVEAEEKAVAEKARVNLKNGGGPGRKGKRPPKHKLKLVKAPNKQVKSEPVKKGGLTRFGDVRRLGYTAIDHKERVVGSKKKS